MDWIKGTHPPESEDYVLAVWPPSQLEVNDYAYGVVFYDTSDEMWVTEEIVEGRRIPVPPPLAWMPLPPPPKED